MLDDGYLRALCTTGRRSLLYTMRGYLRRLTQLPGLSQYDVVLCDQEFLPYFPTAVATLIARRCSRLFVDYDDAAYVKYQRIPGLRNRIPALMAAAEAVVAGNRYLADFASRHNPNVHLIPTVVDTSRYTPKTDYSAPRGVRLVWIGTPVTASFLRPIAATLAALREKYPDLGLRLVGAGDGLRDALPFAKVVPWSEAAEARLLAECDIGLMPLPDNDFTSGKCGLKLIQNMAAGLPVVGSPVGANCDIISEGRDGYFAAELPQWFTALERLIASADLRRELGGNGAAKVARQYSLQRGFESWMSLIDQRDHRENGNGRYAAVAVNS